MGHYRAKDEKLQGIRLGSRYVGLDVGQFYWECLKLVAASEELTETDILAHHKIVERNATICDSREGPG
jgi:hypothetical protein